ncbi:hypothetical protein JRQ81_000036 [Phrynocephalus forsythii]|uniref:Major facilitator superfamily (MFS) profile domain-containing protein n=1 Tax=Phrynocephalus forsythii TaxID=171643 RepID=A0A9Q1APW1_9SAUR|nr:hypothetical protein JRQ81_000036 [Phrynocephalus forsythii]
MAEAMEMMLLSFVGPAVEQLWDLSPRQESAISSVVFAGMMIGAYSWGVLSDSKGRRYDFFQKKLFFHSFGAKIRGTGLASLRQRDYLHCRDSEPFAPNYYTLLFLRALVGIGLWRRPGGVVVVHGVCSSSKPRDFDGDLLGLLDAWLDPGGHSSLGTHYNAGRLGWRWLLEFRPPRSFLLIFYPLVPESPRYYAAKGDTASALAILKKNGRCKQAGASAGEICLLR